MAGDHPLAGRRRYLPQHGAWGIMMNITDTLKGQLSLHGKTKDIYG